MPWSCNNWLVRYRASLRHVKSGEHKTSVGSELLQALRKATLPCDSAKRIKLWWRTIKNIDQLFLTLTMEINFASINMYHWIMALTLTHTEFDSVALLAIYFKINFTIKSFSGYLYLVTNNNSTMETYKLVYEYEIECRYNFRFQTRRFQNPCSSCWLRKLIGWDGRWLDSLESAN